MNSSLNSEQDLLKSNTLKKNIKNFSKDDLTNEQLQNSQNQVNDPQN
jgi:hypothetical protein